MSEENLNEVIEVEIPGNPEAAVEVVGETIEKLFDITGVDKVYGSPIRRGDYTIIPTAEVVAGLGFGVGYGTGEVPSDQADKPQGNGSGGGGGGGGKTISRPVAVVVVEPDGVRVEPIVDLTKVAIAAFTAFGFIFSTRKRMKRGLAE